jgi:hypothetical protein
VALEDTCLSAENPPARAARTIEKLQERWNCSLIPQQLWSDHLRAAGFADPFIKDETAEMIAYYRKLSSSPCHSTAAEPDEAAAWKDALNLAEAGVLKYVRWVATKL